MYNIRTNMYIQYFYIYDSCYNTVFTKQMLYILSFLINFGLFKYAVIGNALHTI